MTPKHLDMANGRLTFPTECAGSVDSSRLSDTFSYIGYFSELDLEDAKRCRSGHISKGRFGPLSPETVEAVSKWLSVRVKDPKNRFLLQCDPPNNYGSMEFLVEALAQTASEAGIKGYRSDRLYSAARRTDRSLYAALLFTLRRCTLRDGFFRNLKPAALKEAA